MNKTFVIISSAFLFLTLAYFGNYNIQQIHSGGFYRTNPEVVNSGDVVYYKEGLYATVSVRELTKEELTRQYSKALFINGVGQGSTEILALRTNFLVTYLPVLFKPEIKNAVVIGMGTGMSSGHLSQFTNVTTIEIESKVIDTLEHFTLFNLNVLENPNHSLIIDDGRNYLLKNKEKYDLIVSSPANVWQSFSTNLFSKEFFELAKEDLTEDGLYLQWVPIYSMNPEDFKSFYKTFNSVFPNVVAFVNIKSDEDTPVKFDTSELIFIGSVNKIEINKEITYENLPEISKQQLSAINLDSNEKINDLLFFTNEQLEGYANDAKIITDDNLLLEFSAGKNVLNQNPIEVIEDINKFLGAKNE